MRLAGRRSPRRGSSTAPSRGLQQAEDRLDQGRLAGAVGADDRDDLALADLDRDAVEDVDLGHVAGDHVLGAAGTTSPSAVLARGRGARAVAAPSRRRRRRGRRRSPPGPRGPRPARRRRSPRPRAITITRSEWFITTSMSCSTKRNVTPSSVRSRCMWSSRRRPSVGLMPAIGSSSSSKRGSRHQRPRQLEQLALAARERAGVVVGSLVEVEDLEQLHRLLVDLGLARCASASGRKTRSSRCSPGWSGAASIMLSITGIAASALVIWKVRTIPRGRSRTAGWPRISSPSKTTAPRVGAVEAGDQVEERRLAGAVGPDQRRDRAPLDVDGRAVDGAGCRRSACTTPSTSKIARGRSRRSGRRRPPAAASVTEHHLLPLAEDALRPERHQQDQDQPDDDEAQRGDLRRPTSGSRGSAVPSSRSRG